ncbi:putative SNARE domain-containing protein [Rosellinia necatrix]|uniref:Putative SNARE domain-containing protein n=1 Tax=Rosellinia necatrix TaxID=77044 RepID=A0A1W2TP28_ROSNE|nr:putative SNARE domain-containing protein [Rosellinia necatrix]
MANPNQLFLLADHIKLSLLERQRAQSLELGGDSNDGHISRSLEQFKDGLTALENELKRLEEAGDEDGALNITDSLPGLKKQYGDLTSQFHGFSSPSTTDTLTHPNDAALSADFGHAQKPFASSSSLRPKNARAASKTVRFSDNPADGGPGSPDVEAQQQRQLFGSRYRDNPDDTMGYRDEAGDMNNVQIHAYHQRVLEQQDEQLDRLGASIARQRELSMQIGSELDDHVAMLDDVDVAVDRHQGRLDRAKRQVNRISRAAGESKQMIAIIILIIVLVLLIAILK